MADGGPILTAGNVGPRRGTEDTQATACYGMLLLLANDNGVKYEEDR